MKRDKRTELVIRETELMKAFSQGHREHAPEIIAIQHELQLQENRIWFRNGETRYFLIHPDGTLQKGTLFRIEDNILYSSLGVFTPEQRTHFYEVRDFFLSWFAGEEGDNNESIQVKIN